MDLQQRLDRLIATRDDYECKNKESNDGKQVIALLGPSAVGKSALIRACLTQAPNWDVESIAEAGTTGTRPPRPGDPSNYHMGVPREEAIDMIEAGEPTNWSLMPTGQIYMTLPRDFTAEYNFMACLPDSLPMLRRAGFAAVHAFYIVTDANKWEEQLASRLYTTDTVNLEESERKYHPEATGRIEEAIQSLEYGKNTHDIIRIANTPGEEHLPVTADIMIQAFTKPSTYNGGTTQMYREFEQNLGEMYGRALDIAWEIEQATDEQQTA